ncbi:hypothetical protein GCM10018790_27090 [Kitasatospora xanthocidica]|uniref:hypothetical protein n=1 Tax=Kitasatospora xanthocidica TaxID=83382 RepID=UPI001674CCAB|nr:hypothetical protein [Kitasatospora xanthocidica]GHF47976.1 hypothetical protein GCM10018790_27090 [Kitasatospora xanthocidica]
MNATQPSRLTAYAVVGAPALMALYGGIRLVPGSREPGLGWTAGHTAMFAGLLLFAPVFLALRRRLAPRGTAGRIAAGAALGTAFAGLLCSLAQIGIDLVVGLAAADKAEQSRLFDRVQGVPGVLPAVYQVGPLLFYVGLLALLVAASVGAARTLRWWSPVLMLVGTVASAADLALIPLAAACYLVALSPLVRLGAGPRPVPA